MNIASGYMYLSLLENSPPQICDVDIPGGGGGGVLKVTMEMWLVSGLHWSSYDKLTP